MSTIFNWLSNRKANLDVERQISLKDKLYSPHNECFWTNWIVWHSCGRQGKPLGTKDGVGMLPSVLWQSGLPCPWIVNAVMTSGASTPAGNYRTNHVIATPQDMHTHAPLSTRAGWRNTGSQHPASTYPSAQCSPPGVALCTCSKSKVETGRERETSVIYTPKKQESPFCS